ncbi:MAG TPA: antibiotic biosynthesis monooxygenase family protein [Jatrophihabitans sp.]|jgi:heme-degrading monooxygenase HmoA|nr:antibiotic biosynthesis monooxygenase family protein [Jatrophihabitans sp.]
MSVRFINLFTVPVGRDERFMQLWTRVNVYMAAQPGYRNHRLHRALSDDAAFRYVNYVEWESDQAWADAHDDGFRERVSDPGWAEFTTTPALFEIVHEGSAGSAAEAQAS